MSHPISLPHPRLTKAELATLHFLIARLPEVKDANAAPAPLPPQPSLAWLDRRFPTG